MTEDADLIADIKNIFVKVMQQNVSLIALPEEPGDKQQIAAVALIGAHSRNDEIVTRLRGPKAEKFERLIDALREDIDVFDKLGTDVLLEDYGLAVASEFRGRHLAHNIILSVEDMARELGIWGKTITLTNLNFSSSAEGKNQEVFRKIIYNDFRDADGNIIVPVTEFKYIAFCGQKFCNIGL